MNDEDAKGHEEVGIFQIIVLILSFVLLGILIVDTVFILPEQISNVLQTIDTLICIVFLIDFGFRFYTAKSKLAFLKWGWLDLIASIPNLPMFQWGRLVRVLRIIRLLRVLLATHKVTTLLLKKRTQGGLASATLTFFLLIMFSSVGILICEQKEPDANIKSAGDAIWWSVSTITTVGYGDNPVTAEGRTLAMVLMICGVGLFGALSGLAASIFVGTRQKSELQNQEILEQIKKLNEKIDLLNQKPPK